MIWRLLYAMGVLAIQAGLFLSAVLDRTRKPPMPKAGTLLIGPDGFYVGDPASWAGASIAGDAVLMVSEDQPLEEGDRLTAWVQCEIVQDRPVIEGARSHKSGTRVYIRVSELDRWRNLTTQETLALMQHLHNSRPEVS